MLAPQLGKVDKSVKLASLSLDTVCGQSWTKRVSEIQISVYSIVQTLSNTIYIECIVRLNLSFFLVHFWGHT